MLSGNLCSGVIISATQNPPNVATGNIVRNNRIGTNASGTQPIPNNTGVHLREGAAANTIGGSSTGAGNVIAGNNGSGILIESAAAGNFILGNAIGVDAAGAFDFGNTGDGIAITGVAGSTSAGQPWRHGTSSRATTELASA